MWLRDSASITNPWFLQHIRYNATWTHIPLPHFHIMVKLDRISNRLICSTMRDAPASAKNIISAAECPLSSPPLPPPSPPLPLPHLNESLIVSSLPLFHPKLLLSKEGKLNFEFFSSPSFVLLPAVIYHSPPPLTSCFDSLVCFVFCLYFCVKSPHSPPWLLSSSIQPRTTQ